MKAGRLVALLLTLQDRRGATAAALADALEVSVRTIYRDVAALQAAGVPLYTEPGPTGGIRLLDGWRTRLDGLTSDEAAALFLGGVPAALDELGMGAVSVAAQAKLLATLPPELRDRAGRLRERFHLDAPGWFARGEAVPHLETVAEAIWEQRVLRLGYRRGQAEGSIVERTVSPLGLVLKAGSWYTVVRTDRGRLLTYRVSRVVTAVETGERFERPEGFDLAKWWVESSAAFDEAMRPLPTRLRLSPRAFAALPRAMARTTQPAVPVGEPDAEGWVEVTLNVESVHVAVHQLLALNGEVEVLAPVELRAALAEVGTALAARNKV